MDLHIQKERSIGDVSKLIHCLCNIVSTATLVYLAFNIKDIIQFIFNCANHAQ